MKRVENCVLRQGTFNYFANFTRCGNYIALDLMRLGLQQQRSRTVVVIAVMEAVKLRRQIAEAHRNGTETCGSCERYEREENCEFAQVDYIDGGYQGDAFGFDYDNGVGVSISVDAAENENVGTDTEVEADADVDANERD